MVTSFAEPACPAQAYVTERVFVVSVQISRASGNLMFRPSEVTGYPQAGREEDAMVFARHRRIGIRAKLPSRAARVRRATAMCAAHADVSTRGAVWA